MTSLPMAFPEKKSLKAAVKNHLNERSYSPEIKFICLSIRFSLGVAIPRSIERRHYNMLKIL